MVIFTQIFKQENYMTYISRSVTTLCTLCNKGLSKKWYRGNKFARKNCSQELISLGLLSENPA